MMAIAKKRMVTAGGSILTVPAYDGDWTGCDGEDDIERQLIKERPRAKDEGRRRDWLSWEVPTAALLAVIVMVGLCKLSSSWVAFSLFILAAMAVACVARCSHKLRRIWVLVTRNLRRKSPTRNERPVRWFIGEEEDENLEGKWVKRYDYGCCYEGEFARGKPHGLGVARFHHGGRYEGDWKEGLPNGYGVEVFPTGSRYEGMFKDGARSGFGKMTFSARDWYSGHWLAGSPDGIGYHRSPYGDCYYGQFKNREKHGLGRFYFRTGDIYAGEYFGDKFHGYGVYQCVDGRCYEGSWHEGRFQGMGMFTSENEDIVTCGDWDSIHLKNHHPPSSARVLKAVESARLAAEKASVLPLANENVQSAMMSSIAKATAARETAENAVRYHERVSFFMKAFGWPLKNHRSSVFQSLQKMKDAVAIFDGWTKWD